MSVVIEGFYIFDDLGTNILEHIYASRPPPAQNLINSIKAHPGPRPSILYLADIVPPTTAYSIRQGNLLIVCTCSKDAQSLAILEFLHRAVDVFEDFLGSPLLSTKIEDNYEIVAQLLGEMCDGGVVCNTEPNALKEQVEVSTLIGKLFSQVGLPGASPALGPSSNLAATLKANSAAANGPAIPWRRPNVRHTSNELYVDMVESLSVIYAPSGRPISARASGSILFSSKISGIPELLLTLSAPGGTSSAKSAGISRTMQLPVFHPCVRLARWKDNPGELSFVPPDGRFMLAGYETDLMPSPLNTDTPPTRTERIYLPCTVDLRPTSPTDFEARLTLDTNFPGIQSSSSKPGAARSTSNTGNPFSFGSAAIGGGTAAGSSSAPALEAVVVTIPFPPDIRSVTELKPSRGEANYNVSTKTIEWKVPTSGREGGKIDGVAVLSGTITGITNKSSSSNNESTATSLDPSHNSLAEYYDEGDITAPSTVDAYSTDINTNTKRNAQSSSSSQSSKRPPQQQQQQNNSLMPRSIAVSFGVKGWLASGIKVESLVVDVKKSKGLGDGVKPYKGVKYLTVSKQGVERRVSS